MQVPVPRKNCECIGEIRATRGCAFSKGGGPESDTVSGSKCDPQQAGRAGDMLNAGQSGSIGEATERPEDVRQDIL